MANIICWICGDELSHKEYSEKKLLDEDGNKPCLQCIFEDEISKEEDDNEF